MSVHGYRSYRPNKYTTDVLKAAFQILASYEAWESPMTVRQVFYRLVAEYSFDKTEKAYGSLVNYIARSRRARQGFLLERVMQDGMSGEEAGELAFENKTLIPFSWIRDEKGQSLEPWLKFEGKDDFLKDVRTRTENMKLDRQENQEQVLEMWCEAAGMVPLMREIADPWGIRVSSGGGYDSVTAKHELAQRVLLRSSPSLEMRQRTIVLHVGDFDPSGEGMFESLRDDVAAMVEDYGVGPYWFEVNRVALTEQQVMEMEVETAPPKPLDSRRRSFIKRHPEIRDWLGTDDITAQLEALRPPELTELIENTIQPYFDTEIYNEILQRESELREDLLARLD